MITLGTFVISTAIVAVFAVFAAMAFFTYRSGFVLVTSLIISIPLAIAVIPMLTTDTVMHSIVAAIPNWVLFVAFVGLFTALFRLVISDGFGTQGAPLQAVLLSLALIVMGLTVWDSVPGLAALYAKPQLPINVGGAGLGFWWFMGSFALLGFSWRSHNRL